MAKALEPLFLVNNNLTEFAKEDFCTAVLEKLINGSPAGGPIGILPCLKELKPTPDAAKKYRKLCDPKAFPDFHNLDNGIMGTYQKMLRSLNTEVTIPSLMSNIPPIIDPTALGPLFGIEPPKLDDLPSIDEIILAFGDVTGLKMSELIGISLSEFNLKVPELIAKIPIPPKLPIPEIPSPELFSLGLDFVPPGIPDLVDTGLVSFQLRTFTTPIKALIGLLPEIPKIALQGFLPSAFGDALCGPISKGFPIKADRPIEAAAYTVMIERSVTAVATAAVAQQLGAGGTVCKTVFEVTGGPTQDKIKERRERLKAEDDALARNDIPIVRGFVPSVWKNKGKGLRGLTYQKIKEIGSTFIDTDTALDGSKLNDDYKGLIILCILHHESGLDPGAATLDPDGILPLPKSGNYPAKGFTDAQVWGMNIVNVIEKSAAYGPNGGPTSMTKQQFITSPVWNPDDPEGILVGMPLAEQLEYYQQYLARMFTAILNKNPQLNGQKQAKQSPIGSIPYTGVRPDFAKRLMDKYNGESFKSGNKDNKYLIQLKNGILGPKLEKNEKPYPVQNIYDIYGFHQGYKGTASNGYGSWLGALKKIPFTLASRTLTMLYRDEHIERYMDSVGMNKDKGIIWDKIVAGVAPYTKDKGMSVSVDENNQPLYPVETGPKNTQPRNNWTKGLVRGKSGIKVANMNAVIKDIQASFKTRESKLGFNPPNVTFDPSKYKL
jgi:hypothetical protein